MITQLGGRPGLFGGDANDGNRMMWVCCLIALVLAVLLVMCWNKASFLGAPNPYNHVAWQGDGVQSAAFNLLRPWDKRPRDDMIYGIDAEEAARRSKIMNTGLSS